MSKMRTKLYTQDKNECTLYTILNIWRTKYGIILNDTEQQEFIDAAKEAWIWSVEKWAIFRHIYNWATWYFYKKYWINITVIAENVISDEFEKLTNEWESWGLGLLYAGKWYRELREDWEITLEEVQDSDKEEEKYYWHNLMWKLWYIIWILRSIPYDKKYIKFSLEALKEAVNKGFFRHTARTFKIEDELIHYYAIELNRWTVFEQIELLDKEHRKALDEALRLRIVK